MGRAPSRLATLLTAGALTLMLGASPALAQSLPATMSLGSPKAKVQLDEYASLSCPHCARFHTEVFPAFKKKYIDTGKVRFVLHEFITPPETVAAAGWLLARCAGRDRYFAVVDGVFRSQPRWTPTGTRQVLLEVAQANGLTEDQFNACLGDRAAIEDLQQRVDDSLNKDKVDSTPTFIVNGKRVKEGEMTLQELDAAIAAARK